MFTGNILGDGPGGLSQSAAEFTLYDALKRQKVNFIPQWAFGGVSGTPSGEHRTADAWLPDNKIVILVDGGFWHSDAMQKQREDIFYQMAGIEVIRLDAHDIEVDVNREIMKVPGLALAMGMLETPIEVEPYGIGRVRKKGQR